MDVTCVETCGHPLAIDGKPYEVSKANARGTCPRCKCHDANGRRIIEPKKKGASDATTPS